MIGEKIHFNEKEYEITKFLGKGKSGYSYIIENGEEKFVLKKIHDEPCPYYYFEDKIGAESSAYEKLKEIEVNIPDLLYINKEEEYLIKEFIDGELASNLIANSKISNYHLEQIFDIAKKAYFHNLNIDFYPENFVLLEDKVYYIDYEINNYSHEWNFENWGLYYWINFHAWRSQS